MVDMKLTIEQMPIVLNGTIVFSDATIPRRPISHGVNRGGMDYEKCLHDACSVQTINKSFNHLGLPKNAKSQQ